MNENSCKPLAPEMETRDVDPGYGYRLLAIESFPGELEALRREKAELLECLREIVGNCDCDGSCRACQALRKAGVL